MITQNKRLFFILLSIAILLSVPLIAMQFSNEVNWSLFDFVLAGGLLLCTGLLCEFTLRRVKNFKARTGIVLAILLALFLVWAELAVGIFGTPFAGN